VKEHRKIKFVIDLGTAKYDAIVAQDVLEHVEDPVQLAHAIANGVSVGGYLIFANSFLPMIKCHLPATFHLRHTFSWVMKKMGLIYVGRIDGANHALVFRRVCEVNLKSARHAEKISNRIGPILNSIRSNLAFAKRFVVSLSAVSK
jgi:2-polyprenyl-6-hydroxyphenyl methylase/3-demethylubiquinone-9 3-methyltransferase